MSGSLIWRLACGCEIWHQRPAHETRDLVEIITACPAHELTVLSGVLVTGLLKDAFLEIEKRMDAWRLGEQQQRELVKAILSLPVPPKRIGDGPSERAGWVTTLLDCAREIAATNADTIRVCAADIERNDVIPSIAALPRRNFLMTLASQIDTMKSLLVEK